MIHATHRALAAIRDAAVADLADVYADLARAEGFRRRAMSVAPLTLAAAYIMCEVYWGQLRTVQALLVDSDCVTAPAHLPGGAPPAGRVEACPGRGDVHEWYVRGPGRGARCRNCGAESWKWGV